MKMNPNPCLRFEIRVRIIVIQMSKLVRISWNIRKFLSENFLNLILLLCGNNLGGGHKTSFKGIDWAKIGKIRDFILF